jgi:hypothetical protein
MRFHLNLFFCLADGTRNAYNGNQAARYTQNFLTVPANITMQYDSQFGGPSIRLKIQESDGHSNNIKALIFQKSVRQGHSHRRTVVGLMTS